MKQHSFYTKNPALIFVLFFILLVIIFAILNLHHLSLKKFSFFTLLWTGLLLLILHTLMNRKNFLRLKRANMKAIIFRSYIQILYLFLPYLMIALIYDNWIIIQQITNPYFDIIDPQLKQIDEVIFSLQPSLWLQSFLHPLAVEYFMIAYSMFFIYPFFYLLYLIYRNQLLLFQKVLFGQNTILILSLILFLIFPAMGPRVLLAAEYITPLQGISFEFLQILTGRPSFFLIQYDLWNFIERVKTDCMPSMHAGLCLLCIIYALKYRKIFKWEKLAVYFWLIGVSSLIISTVYLRYHWIIDVIIGVAFAVIIYYTTEIIFKGWINRYDKKGFLQRPIPWQM